MSFLKLFKPATIILFGGLGLTACDGSSSNDVTPSDGTAIVAEGSITAFGSIYVNGVEYETQTALINVDDDSGGEMRLGMKVLVKGTVDNNGLTGSATSVDYDEDVEGPIDTTKSFLLTDDGLTKEFTVLGIQVVVDKANTVFDDITFDDIQQNAKLVIEVSGFVDENGKLQATRVEGKGVSVPGFDEVEVKGTVSGFDSASNSFTLTPGNLTVVFDGNTDMSELPGGLADGLFVEVKGILQADGITIDAGGPDGEIELEDDAFDDDVAKVSVEGFITDFNPIDNTFTIDNNQAVNFANAVLEPASLVLKDGIKVEVEGPIVSGVLNALEVKARGGKIKVEASVSAISTDDTTGATTVTLDLLGGSVNVLITNTTRLEDDITSGSDDSQASFLINLAVDDFLEVKGFQVDVDSNLVTATRIKKDEADDARLQAPVQVIDVRTLTLLGIEIPTDDAEFEDDNDNPLSAGDFFNQVLVGSLVKIKDKEPVDTVADEVELENDD